MDAFDALAQIQLVLDNFHSSNINNLVADIQAIINEWRGDEDVN